MNKVDSRGENEQYLLCCESTFSTKKLDCRLYVDYEDEHLSCYSSYIVCSVHMLCMNNIFPNISVKQAGAFNSS